MDLLRLSKTISHALRHDPGAYGITLDAEGWVEVEELIEALRAKGGYLGRLEEADLTAMLARAEKQRFEVREGRIRAVYGHSLAVKVARLPVAPPEKLFHGTSAAAVEQILRDGLKPMDRQYVHLSADVATATEVGRRKAPEPVILEIAAGDAQRAGVRFYLGNQTVWLADEVPATWIRPRQA